MPPAYKRLLRSSSAAAASWGSRSACATCRACSCCPMTRIAAGRANLRVRDRDAEPRVGLRATASRACWPTASAPRASWSPGSPLYALGLLLMAHGAHARRIHAGRRPARRHRAVRAPRSGRSTARSAGIVRRRAAAGRSAWRARVGGLGQFAMVPVAQGLISTGWVGRCARVLAVVIGDGCAAGLAAARQAAAAATGVARAVDAAGDARSLLPSRLLAAERRASSPAASSSPSSPRTCRPTCWTRACARRRRRRRWRSSRWPTSLGT